MARDLILHIGIHKTGSTSIQKTLALRRKEILAQDMYYPRSPGYEKHGLLESAAQADRESGPSRSLKFSSPEVKLAEFRGKFDAEMRALPANVRRVIISSERFSHGLTEIESIQNLRDLLTPYFDGITVVAYLRRPDLHLTSLYSEMIRWGDARPPGLAGLQLPSGHKYNYYRMLRHWARVFGKNAVKPQIFEHLPGKKFDVVRHFNELCGLDLEPSSEKSLVNEALSLPAQLVLVELARQIHEDGKRGNVVSAKWRSIVKAAAAALPGKGWQPSRAEAQAFNARFEKNLERVRERWFPERETLFSADYTSLPETAPTVEPGALFEAAARVLHEMGNREMQLEDELAKLRITATEGQGDGHRMHRHLARRVELFPDNVEAQVDLARLLARKGDVAAAEHLISGALKLEPKHKAARSLRRELANRESRGAEESAQADMHEPAQEAVRGAQEAALT